MALYCHFFILVIKYRDMAVNIEVTKGSNENNLSVLRRFTKRVQGAGVLPRVRSIRYSERLKSENVKRAKTLSYLKRKAELQELIKLGKAPEVTRYGKRKR
jgi:ribosomal protein S21